MFERHCELANKKADQLYKVFKILARMIINSSRRKSNQFEKCQMFAHNLSWHELDDVTFCVVNKLARPVTTWTSGV